MAKGLLSLLALFLLTCLSRGARRQLTQSTLDYISSNLDIRYDVIDNLQDTWKTYRVRMIFTNNGDKPIPRGSWAIYFCHIRVIESKHTKHNPKGYVIPGGYGLRVFHINGCQHKFETTADFKNLEPNKSLKYGGHVGFGVAPCNNFPKSPPMAPNYVQTYSAEATTVVFFNSDFWAVARTDVMPNMFVAAAGLQARTIVSTAGESLSFVGPFNAPKKWKRLNGDKFDPYTPLKRFEINNIADLRTAPNIVIPTPMQVTNVDKTKQMNIGTGEWRVVAGRSLASEARFLAEKVQASFDQDGATGSRTIQLRISDVIIGGKPSSCPEAYGLDVDVSREVITIVGKSAAAVFHGVQSLLSLSDGGKVHQVCIRDKPRYGYRGMEIDVGRNFMKKEEILRLLDAMSMYKLNKFHFHLTDDEGWRLEIPGLPELTEIGSRRCFDIKEEKCVGSQLGSGAGSGNSGTGFYTVSEYQEILRYAQARHIEVIPEFDMPGHGHAAIIAMLARYRKFMTRGDTVRAQQYLLSDPADKSEYLSVQFFTDNAINPCLDSTYSFIEHLVSTIKRIHVPAQPLKVFHFGGDEVAKGAWTKSPKCEALAKKLGLDFTSPTIVKDLKEHFVRRVAAITNKYRLDAGAWEDGVLGVNDTPYDRSFLKNKNVYAYAWDNVWEWMQGNRAYKLANAGYKVVMTQATHLYFDHPYEPDPEERGYYWAPRFIDTRKTFGFMPDDLYANADFTRMGDPIVDLCENLYKGKCVPLNKPANIAGMAGALWSETVRTPEQLHSMIYPRLLALAERAWHKASWETEKDQAKRKSMKDEDWKRFANTLGHKELARLDKMNLNYHIPPPGVMIYNGGQVKSNSAMPGLQVQYSKDEGKTWCDVKPGKTYVWGKLKFATRSADRRRLSRSVSLRA